MRAIDFACRLLLRIEQIDMPTVQIRILIALGAGLETCQDISRHCNLSSQQTAAQLCVLERHRHVTRIRDKRNSSYQLSDRGKEQLRELLNFIPLQRCKAQ